MNLRRTSLCLLTAVVAIGGAMTAPAAWGKWIFHDASQNATQLVVPAGGNEDQGCADRVDGESGFYLLVDVENGEDPLTYPVPKSGWSPVAYDVYEAPSGSTFELDGTDIVYRDASNNVHPAPLVTTFSTTARTRPAIRIRRDGGDTTQSGDYILTIAEFSEPLPGVQPGEETLLRLSGTIGVPIIRTAVACERVRPNTTITAGPRNGAWRLSSAASLAYTSSEAGSTFKCRLDGTPVHCDPAGLALSGLGTTTHTFSVAARDTNWNTDATPARRTWTVPLGAAALGRDTRWQLLTSGATYQGTFLEATMRGATVSTRVTGARKLALVASKGLGHGTVKVFAGRNLLRTVSLAASSARTKQVIQVASFGNPRTARIRVVVSSRGKPVHIEGLGVATR